MNVLLVANESKTRSQLKTALEFRGHQVSDHKDSKTGWAAYKTDRYPMVIVDCSQPGGDGLELCQRIRGTAQGHESLILVIADDNRFQKLGLVLAALADDHLKKPFNLQELNIRLEIVEQRVNKRQQQTSSIKTLHENNEFFDKTQHITLIGSWKHDIKTKEISCSDGIFHILEIKKLTSPDNYKILLNLIHPEDRNMVIQGFNNAMAHHIPCDMSHRLLMPDGRIKWVTERYETYFDEQGKPHYTVGTIQDITKYKHTDNELKFASLIYKAFGDAVIITDGNNRIQSINQGFTQLSGFSAEELIGKLPNFFYSPRHDAAFNQALLSKLSNTGIWEGEVWNQHKNGDEYATWQLIHTIHDDSGKVLNRVVLISSITEQKRTEETIRRQAYYDLLTGLPNRRLFQDRLGFEIKKANRTALPISLLFLDLDHFKEVNDTHGHDIGDTLLREAASRISSCVRQSDTVARLGGDEFTVILSDIPDASHTDSVARKIIAKLAEPYLINGETINISASIGITTYPEDADSINELMKNADRAMYIAKKLGRNRLNYFSAPAQQTKESHTNFVYDLRGAVAAGQLKVYYQPVIDLSTGRIAKAEALLRWHHPTHGTISPVQFIPLAEDAGLINQIGDWVFKESAYCAKLWGKQFSNDFQVGINLSPIQLRSGRKNFAAEWLNHLQEMDIAKASICIEVSEGLLINSESMVKSQLQALREAGIHVAIDNFSDKSTIFSQYKKLDFDYLKIDQSLILNFAKVTDETTYSDIIIMAHKLGFKVIAKGVESEGQHDLLVAANCDYAQGNLYSRPIPADEFETLMKHVFIIQPPATINVAGELSNQTLLSDQETADFLQPYMRGKSIKTWLLHNRQSTSAIPFSLVRGLPCYRVADLKAFINNTLKPKPRFAGFKKRLVPERRVSTDRRKNAELLSITRDSSHNSKQRRRADLESSLQTASDRRSSARNERRNISRPTLH